MDQGGDVARGQGVGYARHWDCAPVLVDEWGQNAMWRFPLFRIVERFQAKWTPVRVKKTRQIKNL
jgi:hypothetical protein